MRIAKIHDFRLDKINESEEIELDLSPCEYHDDFGLFEDDKEFKSFIIHLKFYIRNSFEYKRLMIFLKDHKNLNRCGVHPNVTREEGFQIQIHHTPFTMEDIIYIVLKKRKECNETLKMTDVAEEIMYLHYLGLVGLYPLCETCHQYVHSDANDLFIPLDKVYGDPISFANIYEKYIIDTPLGIKFDNIKILNKGYSMIKEAIPTRLRKKYIYVKMSVKVKGNEDYILSTSRLFDLMSKPAKMQKLLDEV